MTGKKVLGIYGSPREGGNSDLLLNAALDGAKSAGAEVSSVTVRDLAIPGCRECGGCEKDGKCVWDDSMQKVYPFLQEADAIFVASPIFFYAFPAQLKALIDRAQAEWSRRYLVNGKQGVVPPPRGKGYLLAVGATKGKNLFVGVELTAKYFFDALGLRYEGGILVRGSDGKGDVRNRPEYLEQARELGRQAGAPAEENENA